MFTHLKPMQNTKSLLALREAASREETPCVRPPDSDYIRRKGGGGGISLGKNADL